jgi:multidrug resistance efflux pump
MNRKWILPTLTFTALGFVLTFVIVARPKAAPTTPPALPAVATNANLVAATGLVEPESETIQISCAVSGMVTRVFAPAGTRVAANAPLFEIDGRELQAQLELKYSQMAAQQARLDRLLAEPRPEELPAYVAHVEQSKAQMEDAQTRYDLIKSVSDERAVTSENVLGRKHALDTATAQYLQSVADLNLKKAGAWKPDIAQSRADLAQAAADVEQTRLLIERLTVRAPMNGKVLQSHVRLGQFANCAGTDALMLFGGGDHLNVRAQIDENDAWRVRPSTPTYGYIRGNTAQRLALQFVRFEPYVVPKQSLTGDTTERVDTRVLEVIYRIADQNATVYPGQQMDVFTETPVTSPITRPGTSSASTAGTTR